MTNTENTEKTRNPIRPEYYCFKCQISAFSEEGTAPKCGASECHFTKLPKGKEEFKEALNELTAKLNKSLEEISKLKKELLAKSNVSNEAKK